MASIDEIVIRVSCHPCWIRFTSSSLVKRQLVNNNFVACVGKQLMRLLRVVYHICNTLLMQEVEVVPQRSIKHVCILNLLFIIFPSSCSKLLSIIEFSFLVIQISWPLCKKAMETASRQLLNEEKGWIK